MEQKKLHPALVQLLSGMNKYDASDLHLKVGYPPFYRVVGDLRKLELPVIQSSDELEEMLVTIIPSARRAEYEERGDLDFSYRGTEGERYRCNVFRASGEITAALRRVKGEIPTYEELRLPAIYNEFVERTHEGLILISGVTGCGKSSTLAAMLDHVNATRRMHIITIEDPIEFAFTPKKSIISQREIGIDIPDFAEALRYVVRQDPDVILIGELRDKDTMMAALQAAETGHLVFASIHTSDATQAFSRILEFFPRNQHEFIRSSMANSLKAVCCQRLVPASDEAIGRLPATEVLLVNATVVDKIRREEDEDIPAIMATSVQEGMRTFTHSLAELIEQEMIYFDVGMKYAPNRDALAASVRGIKASAGGLVSR